MNTHVAASLAATAVMLLCAFATGNGALRALRITVPPVEAALAGVAIGLGIQATLLLGLATAGWMHPVALWAAVVVPALPDLPTWRHLRLPSWRGGASAFGDIGAGDRISLTVTLTVVAALLVVGALGPVADWDSLMYHVQLPRLFLDAGRLYVPPDGLHVAYLGSVQFLYLPFLSVGASAAPALLNAALTFGLGAAVIMAGEQFLSRGTGVLAGIALWGSSALLIVGMTPRIDITLMYFLLLTHVGMLRVVRDSDTKSAMRYFGLLAGITVGIKYHALPYIAALVPFALWVVWREPAQRAARLRALASAAVLATAGALPWLAKNFVLFGAPLYPFFAERIVPPFIAAIQGSSEHPSNVSTAIYGALGQAREAVSLAGLILRPATLTVEGEAAAFTRNWFLWLAPFGVLLSRRYRLTLLALLLPALAYLGVALGPFTKTNVRYLLPIVPVMALAAAEALTGILERAGSARWHRPACLAAVVAICVPAFDVVASRTFTPIRLRIAAGVEAPEALLAGDPHFIVAKWFAENSPPDAQLLMLFDARGLHHRRATIQDNVLTNWPLLVGTGAVERCLSGTGITHVLMNRGVLNYYVTRGLDPRLLDVPRFDAFAERCLQPMGTLRDIDLYRVR